MPTFIIEREIPGADKLTAAELRDISAKSNEVVAGLSVPYKWVTSYVAGDKIYCVHEALRRLSSRNMRAKAVFRPTR